MGFLAYAYAVMALFTGVPAMWRLGFWLGLCGTLAPLIALVAGSTLAEVNRRRDFARAGTSGLAVALLIGITVWGWVVGWHLNIFGTDVPGVVEVALGGALGVVHGWIAGRGPSAQAGKIVDRAPHA